jgi:thioredoxin 1
MENSNKLASIKILTEEQFKAKLDLKEPMVVDFFATWCGPCKALSPVLEKLAEKFDGKIRIYKIDVGSSGGLAQEYRVMSVPTIIFFRDGVEFERINGAVPLETLENTIKKMI